MSQPRNFSLRAKFVIAIAVGLGALVLAEGVLRVGGIAAQPFRFEFKGIQGTVPDPELFWRFVTRGGHDPIHDIGIRGDVFPATRSPRDLRVLCVGDSCTFGLFVLPNESYGKVLERRLQARLPHGHVHAVLAAAPGYSTYQDIVLLRRNASLFAADVTVLYVGSCNDMAVASGYRDSEYGADIEVLEHHPVWSSRLGRLIWRTLHPIPGVDEKTRRLQSAPLPEQTAAARVSLGEFRSNVRTLVGLARENGVVLAVIPGSASLIGNGWAVEYRRVLIETYQELRVPSIDSDEVFRGYSARHPEEDLKVTDFLCEGDHVHPSVIGHEALAEALEPLLLDTAAARVASLAEPAPTGAAKISTVEPATLRPGHMARVRIDGSGFSGAGAPRRILVDDHPVAFTVRGDDMIDAVIEPEFLCRPGRLSIEVRTSLGVLRPATSPEVLPWTPELVRTEHDGRHWIRLSIDTEGCLAVNAWISPRLLDEPRKTKWGQFRLAPPGQAPHPDGAFRDRTTFAGLDLPRIEIVRLERGPAPATGEIEIPAGLDPKLPLRAQVLFRFGFGEPSAWLSGVLDVRGP